MLLLKAAARHAKRTASNVLVEKTNERGMSALLTVPLNWLVHGKQCTEVEGALEAIRSNSLALGCTGIQPDEIPRA